jgi:hypothetical protein
MLTIKLKRKITFSKPQSCVNNISYNKHNREMDTYPFHPSRWSFFDNVHVFLLNKKILLHIYWEHLM